MKLDSWQVRCRTFLQNASMMTYISLEAFCGISQTSHSVVRPRFHFHSFLPTDKPTPPQRPVEIVETSLTAIEFKWKPPKDDGGCPVKHYILERQQVGGSKTWTNVGELPNDPLKYRDTNVKPGKRYCYHIRAKNEEGVSDVLETEDIQAGILCKYC